MARVRSFVTVGLLALSTALGSSSASAKQIKTVFVIAMENHNWTQPANQFTGRDPADFSESERAIHQ